MESRLRELGAAAQEKTRATRTATDWKKEGVASGLEIVFLSATKLVGKKVEYKVCWNCCQLGNAGQKACGREGLHHVGAV